MPITYDIKIEPTENANSFHITCQNSATGAQFSFEQSSSDITEEEVTKLWLLRQYQAAIGKKLFRFLDGDERYFHRALEEAATPGKQLLPHLRICKAPANLPFELLALDSNFLLVGDAVLATGRVYLVRHVSDWDEKKE